MLLAAVGPAQFRSFGKHLEPAWIAESLKGTGTIRARAQPDMPWGGHGEYGQLRQKTPDDHSREGDSITTREA